MRQGEKLRATLRQTLREDLAKLGITKRDEKSVVFLNSVGTGVPDHLGAENPTAVRSDLGVVIKKALEADFGLLIADLKHILRELATKAAGPDDDDLFQWSLSRSINSGIAVNLAAKPAIVGA